MADKVTERMKIFPVQTLDPSRIIPIWAPLALAKSEC